MSGNRALGAAEGAQRRAPRVEGLVLVGIAVFGFATIGIETTACGQGPRVPADAGQASLCDPLSMMGSGGRRVHFRVVWLDRESNVRKGATRIDVASARELARQMLTEGHSDVRYRRSGEREWRAVRPKEWKVSRKRRETPFPPKAPKKPAEKKRSDALDKRLPGSFESGKRR